MPLELKNLLNNGSLKITNTSNSGNLLIYLAYQNALTDEDNNILTDEDGNYLAIDLGA